MDRQSDRLYTNQAQNHLHMHYTHVISFSGSPSSAHTISPGWHFHMLKGYESTATLLYYCFSVPRSKYEPEVMLWRVLCEDEDVYQRHRFLPCETGCGRRATRSEWSGHTVDARQQDTPYPGLSGDGKYSAQDGTSFTWCFQPGSPPISVLGG